jgi:hypothetical protein
LNARLTGKPTILTISLNNFFGLARIVIYGCPTMVVIDQLVPSFCNYFLVTNNSGFRDYKIYSFGSKSAIFFHT